ncbi:MAG TPA: hypothetical protein VMU38_10810 [Candidatus Binatia bacterium]|nr:hypothetical protein [Candidatus Binatia bacterium]
MFVARILVASTVISAAAVVNGALSASADAPPLRHLVYNFTYSSHQEGNVPNEAGSSGAQTYAATLDDKGTIAVDVLREAQDRGLVVSVSEQGEHTRNSAPATCAVYGTTDVACDPDKQVNREEYTLLRFLGVNFVDLSRIDEKQHWSVAETKGNVAMSADYVISSNDSGVLKIGETRHVEDKQGGTTYDIETKIAYAPAREIPISIDEYAKEERHGGVNGVYHTTYQTTLTLASDSLAKP